MKNGRNAKHPLTPRRTPLDWLTSLALARVLLTDDHCFIDFLGRRYYRTRDNGVQRFQEWEGQGTAGATYLLRGTHAVGNCIDMLLDLDQGSMTIYKNGLKIGVMVGQGLTGPLRWAASMAYGSSVRIESANADFDVSPTTDEEAAAAMAWRFARRREWLELGPGATDAECEVREATPS